MDVVANDEHCGLSIAAREQQGSFKRQTHCSSLSPAGTSMEVEGESERARESKTCSDLKKCALEGSPKPYTTDGWGDGDREGVPD